MNKVFLVLMLVLGFVAGTSVAVAYASGVIDLVGDVVVDGAVTIQDGTEGLGKVFTSDSVGTGSWQDPAPAGLMQTPIGTVLSYAGTTAPANYMIADGSEISRTSFSELFNIIGTTYGAGDGSTTFNLPDLNDKLVRGTFPGVTPGTTGGEPTHKHPINGIVAAFTFFDGEHTHIVDPPGKLSSIPTSFDDRHGVTLLPGGSFEGPDRNHRHTTDIDSFESSSGGSHNHRFSIPFQFTESGTSLPPFIELVMIIRVQ